MKEVCLFVLFQWFMKHTRYGLLEVCCCTSFANCFGISIKTTVVIDNDDPLSFYPLCNHGIKHHINKL